MAYSKPMSMGQTPVLCQLCEVDSKIQWKCIDCDLLLCTKCKDKIHSKVKTAEEHTILNIKEIGKQSDQDEVRPVYKHLDSLELAIVQEYSTKFPVSYIEASLEDSFWIGSGGKKKGTLASFISTRHLQHVKLKGDHLKIISSFNVDVRDIAITPSNNLILADVTPKLKQILHNSNKVTESNYCVESYNACSVHVTRDNKVVVGARSVDTGAAVYEMDMNGEYQNVYKHDKKNKLLFTYPYKISSTANSRLCVIDNVSSLTYGGRLVILGQGEIITIYTGHPDINSDKKRFIPWDIISTLNDNVIVSDPYNNTLHILNNRGRFLAHYDTQKIGIQYPRSLTFNTAGQFSILYIGCSSDDGNGKLYKLNLTGY